MSSSRIAIVDAGGANIASLRFALARLGHDAELTAEPTVIRAASHVILPGVGAAQDAMQRLKASGLNELITDLDQPVFGICLGMQLLFEGSEEEQAECLGILPGVARRFAPEPGRPVPHMGWNRVFRNAPSSLFDGIPDGAQFYFVHSYALPVGKFTTGSCEYGQPFSAAVQKDNYFATQFHPERSGRHGARLLENFLRLRGD